MIHIKQTQGRKIIYEADIEKYEYNIPAFIKNGATKITIEYPTSTVTIQPLAPSERRG